MPSALAIFVVSVAVASALLALALRAAGSHRTWRGINAPESLSLSDAAKFAYRQAAAEHLPLARVLELNNMPDGIVAWLMKSIRKVVPAKNGSDGAIVSRREIRRYVRWLRAVQ